MSRHHPHRSVNDDLVSMRAAIDELDRAEVADAIETIGFECTDCGACCRGDDADEHVATVFPDEARQLMEEDEQFRDVVQPMPFGLGHDGTGVTIEWSLPTDDCGDCRFLKFEDEQSHCTRYDRRPSICRTYPFTLRDSPEAAPQGEAIETVGPVVAHECEGLGTHIDRASALTLADELIERARRSIEEGMSVRGHLAQQVPDTAASTVVIDSEGPKTAAGTPIDDERPQR